MLLIILGVVVIILSIRWINKCDFYKKTFMLNALKASLFTTLGLFIAIVGLGAPLHGYHEPVIAEEYELCEIVEDSKVYIIEDNNRTPYFKCVAYSDKRGVWNPYDDLSIEIIVSDEYDQPKLVEYYIKPKIGVLSFGLFGYSREYKIYAAEENIKRFEQ